jgi:hypothetical protein
MEMYIVVYKERPKGSWRAMPKIYDDREKADTARDKAKASRDIEWKVAYIGDKEDWK